MAKNKVLIPPTSTTKRKGVKDASELLLTPTRNGVDEILKKLTRNWFYPKTKYDDEIEQLYKITRRMEAALEKLPEFKKLRRLERLNKKLQQKIRHECSQIQSEYWVKGLTEKARNRLIEICKLVKLQV